MRIFTRYVLVELAKVFSVTLVAATLLMLLAGVLQQSIQQGLGLEQILRLLPYVLPDALRFAVPGTTLFAVCSVYGRMAAGNEIVAIKSLGISPMAAVWPVLVASCLVSFVAIWLNDIAVSWGRSGVRRVVIESVEQIAYGMLRSKQSYSTSRLSISVKRVEDRMLIQPMVVFRASGTKPSVTITAEHGMLRTDPVENTLAIMLHRGSIDVGDGVRFRFPDTIERVIPLPDASNASFIGAGPSELPLWTIPAETVRQGERIEELEAQLASKAAWQMLLGDFDLVRSAAWAEDYDHLRDQRQRLFRLQCEPHRRWANGFSCLCFVLVGIPLAMRLRNSDFLTSFFLCFLPILLVYYPLLAGGVSQAKNGAVPPYAVWLGNVILAVCGAWLMRRVLRY